MELTRCSPASRAVIKSARKPSPAPTVSTIVMDPSSRACMVAFQQPGASGPQRQCQPLRLRLLLQVAGLLQCTGPWNGRCLRLVVARLDEMGLLQGAHHVGLSWAPWADARALGGALLPLNTCFASDTESFLKA